MRFLPKIAALLCLFSCFLLSSINTSIAQTSGGSITVGGDFDKFYPVTWDDPAWYNNECTVLKIGRSSVHENSTWRGALMTTFNYHLSFWGHGAHFVDADIKNSVVNFIAGWRDASTGGGSGLLVIWLRGGNSTYYYHSNYAITPTVYDNVQNALPFQEHNGPAHTFKTEIDSYVNSSGITNSGVAYYLSSGANFFNGSLGIGTKEPIGKLHVAGTFSGGIIQDGNDRPGIGVSGQYPQAVLMAGGTNNPSHGPTVMLGSYDSGTSGTSKHWSIGTAGQGSTFLDIGYGVNDLNPHSGIRNYNGSTIMTLLNTGYVGIGTIKPDSKLTVAGKIHAREVKVSVEAGADFVFAKDYTLKPLSEVADFINENKHLPEVASANQMKKEGVELGDMNIKLLQKIEELTLYLIEQNKEIKALKISNEELKSEVLKIKTCK